LGESASANDINVIDTNAKASLWHRGWPYDYALQIIVVQANPYRVGVSAIVTFMHSCHTQTVRVECFPKVAARRIQTAHIILRRIRDAKLWDSHSHEYG